jgi:hypothetical protein
MTKQHHKYLFGTDVIRAFTTAGLVPDVTQSIDIKVTNEDYVMVTAVFALSTQQLEGVVDGLPRR